METVMKRYFAGQSTHGSETAHGFANDWGVFVFNSKASRDEFIENSKNLSTVAVLAVDATKRAANYSLTRNEYNKPKPFSGEYWGIVEQIDGNEIHGCLGVLAVCDEYEPGINFYK